MTLTDEQIDAPEKIWIEHDDCPYFYEESELTEVGSPVTEYTRSDLVAELEAENEWLKHALEAANKRVDEAEAAREAMREDRDSQQRVCIAVMTERDALRARVAELEGALRRHTVRILTIPGETGDAIRGWSCGECNPGWFDSEDTIAHRDSCVFAALKGASHAE